MAKEASAANPEIEDFDPHSEWAEDEESGTLIVMLPGFRVEQLLVQIISTGMLRISGEREIDINKRRRFVKEYSLPANYDITRIGAKLEGGLLHVKIPKPSAHASTQPPMTQEPPAMSQSPPPPAPVAPTPKADQQMASQEVTPPKTDEVTQKPPEKEKEQESEPKEKGKEMDENAKKLEKGKKKKKQKEKIGPSGIGKHEAKVETKLPSLSVVYRIYRESFDGLMEGLKRQKKVVNLVLAILFVLVLGLYVKDAIKSSSGGSKIQEL